MFFNIIIIIAFLKGWREDQNATKSEPSLACQQNAIEMTFRWHGDNGPPLNLAW